MSDPRGRSILIVCTLILSVAMFAGCEDNSLPKKPTLGRINPETRKSALEEKVNKAAAYVKAMKEKNLELAEAIKMKDGLLHNNNIFINELEMQIEDLLKYGGASRRDTITLDDQFFFKPGSADLTDQGKTYLMKIARELSKIDYLVRVEGHTDSVPVSRPAVKAKFDDNWGLSAGRASSVIRFLQTKGGIPGKRLIGQFHGPYRPIAENTPKGNMLNRRVEIRLIPPFFERQTTNVGITTPQGDMKGKIPDRNYRSTRSFLDGGEPERVEPEVRRPVRIEEPVRPQPEGVQVNPPKNEAPVRVEDEPEDEPVDDDTVPVILK